MENKWTRKTIAECASDEPYSTQIGPFGKALTPEEYTSSGVPLLRGVNVNRGRFYDDGFVFISEETADRLSKFESHPGDILLVHKGTLGQIGMMPSDRKYHRYIMGNSMLRVRCDPAKLIPEYLYYWLCSHEGQHYLFSRVSQVGVPQIQRPLTTLREASLPVPPLDEQKAIAHILGTLDDKIELNQQTNQTLEAIARALFKSWFIDFDPVRAKMDGRQPAGMDAETAALFPAEFEDGGAIGKIPAGWRSGVLKDISENPKRTIRPEQIPVGTPYVGLEHMPKRSIALSDWGVSDNVESNKFQFENGDILFGKLRPYFHKVGVAIQNGVCSTDILVIIPKCSEWFSLALAYVSSDGFVEYTNMSSDGTRMPRTNWQVMGQYPITIPSLEVAKAFNTEVSVIVQTIRSNIFQLKTLASIRDTLLPKLLSGEICVKDAEKVVEAVV